MAGGDRSKADSALVAALAAGSTTKDAAKTAGVSESTIYRRLREPEFRGAVSEARRVMIEQAVGALSDASSAAVTTLKGLLEADAETVKLGAARAILELGARLRETVAQAQLAEDVAELRQQLAALMADTGAAGPRAVGA